MTILISEGSLHELNDALTRFNGLAEKVELSANTNQALNRLSTQISNLNAQGQNHKGLTAFDIPATVDLLKQGELSRLAGALSTAVQPQYDMASNSAQMRMGNMSAMGCIPIRGVDLTHAAYGSLLGASQKLEDVCATVEKEAKENPASLAENAVHKGPAKSRIGIPLISRSNR